MLSGRPIALGSVVRWEEAPYANGILDTILSQARRDRQEYGQSQLRLVVAFLRWHDLKGERGERISSPLLLLPVTLTKQRGVRDSFLLQAESPEAEVNPALRQHLKQLYDLELPATLDLARVAGSPTSTQRSQRTSGAPSRPSSCGSRSDRGSS